MERVDAGLSVVCLNTLLARLPGAQKTQGALVQQINLNINPAT
jgi:hypothetical protein